MHGVVSVLEKVIVTKLVKEFPSLRGTRRFISLYKNPPPLVPIPRQMNQIHIFTLCLSILTLFSNWSFSFGFPIVNLCTFLVSQMHVTCHIHSSVLDLTTQICSELDELWSSSYVFLFSGFSYFLHLRFKSSLQTSLFFSLRKRKRFILTKEEVKLEVCLF